MKNITIVKVGGAVVEDEARLEALLDDFAALEGPKMLVHGGGRRATKVAEALGVESRMVNGRRVTGKEQGHRGASSGARCQCGGTFGG